MAGIGFELKKVFGKKGVLSMLKGYAMSGVVVTGPMFLSISLLVGIKMIYDNFGIEMTPERQLLNTLITYTTLFSVVWVNAFCVAVIRYVSDVIFVEKYEKVMPSFYGSVTLLLLFGELFYGVFLCIMGIPLKAMILALILFAVFVVVWMQINYLSSIKNYRGILMAFALGVVCGLASGYATIGFFKGDVSYAVIIAVIITYSVLAVCYQIMLSSYFPAGQGSMFAFLEAMETNRNLLITGIFMQIGLYGHIVVMWFSRAGEEVSHGLHQSAVYDVPAMMAFLTSIVTMINIVISLEVNVYPYFSRYVKFLNKGSVIDIKKAENRMKRSLFDEIYYCMFKQFVVTITCMVLGSMLLRSSLFGMSEEMIGVFRVLCVGYGMYASGYALILVMFYLNYHRVYLPMVLFAVLTITLTFVFSRGDERLYGVGLVISGMVFLFTSFAFLLAHMKDVLMHIFVDQQMTRENTGLLTRLARKSEKFHFGKEPEKEAQT